MSSVKERAAARRKQLQQQHTFVLPLDGYEDSYAVRYKVLTYDQIWQLQQDTGGTGQSAEQDVWFFADTVIRSCLEFLEVHGTDDAGNPEYQSTGHQWTPEMARELFDVELGEDATPHDAVFAVYAGDDGPALLALHARAHGEASDRALLQVNEGISGNSEARSAPEALSISQ